MRIRAFVVAAFACLALAGCGEKTDITTFAETEGIYVDVGNLVYQVQLSRYLNPADPEDKEYLVGIPPNEATLTGGEIWFGVWMRVKNYSNETLMPTTQFVINDTEGNKYYPIKLPESNVFAYNPKPLGPDAVLPAPNTAAANGPIQGSLILFKLKIESTANRPLVLHIQQPGQDEAQIDLDL